MWSTIPNEVILILCYIKAMFLALLPSLPNDNTQTDRQTDKEAHCDRKQASRHRHTQSKKYV